MNALLLALNNKTGGVEPQSIRGKQWIVEYHKYVMAAESKRPSTVLKTKDEGLIFAENRIICARDKTEAREGLKNLKKALLALKIDSNEAKDLSRAWYDARARMTEFRNGQSLRPGGHRQIH